MDSAVKDFLLQHDDFVFISHISPDGDTLGSSLALYMGLTALGKRVQLVCCQPVPQIYRFCPGAERFLLSAEAVPAAYAVAIDCGDTDRLGDAEPLFAAAKGTLVIDHHATNTGFGDINRVEQCGATGELIYLLLRELGVEITANIATCLYVAIAADTGNFSYSNTTERSFHIAGALLESGFDMAETNRNLFRTHPRRHVLLQAELVRAARFYRDGALVIACATLDMMARCGATGADMEGLIDDLRDIDTVEIAMTLREEEDGAVRVSLRGKKYADVASIALLFDGGGHRLSAGCTFHIPMEEAAEQLRLVAEAQLETLGR